MAITNTNVVDTTEKYIVRSQGVGGETDQVMVDAENLIEGNNKSLVSLIECYSKIFETTPAPTVLPPSLIAKRNFSSIAIGAIRSTVNFKLSPGITISVPEGS